jgi:hypothetical protein
VDIGFTQILGLLTHHPKALVPLFVMDVLILSWENKFDKADISEAMVENVSKLKAWSPLIYYGKLPYVIGGCCAGRQFSMAEALSKWQGNCS